MVKKILRNSGVQLIGKAIGLTASLIATALITRKLGVTNYGHYIFLIAFINLMAAFGNWGTQIIGVRELAKSKNRGTTFGSLFYLRTVLGLIATLIALIAIITLGVFADIRLISIVSLPIIISLIIESTFEVVFQSFIKMEAKTKIDIAASATFLATTYFFLRVNFGLVSPIIGWGASRVISILLSVPWTKRLIREKISVKEETVKYLAKESLPLGMLLILFSVYDQAVDSLIIKNFLGPTQVGFYGLSYKIYTNLVLPAYFFSNTILPILSKDPKRKFFKLMSIGLKFATFALIILTPTVLILAKPIIQLIAGKNFLPSVAILKILSFALIFSYLNHLTGFSLIALNRQIDSLKIGLVALVWNLSLNLILIPKQGIQAAAWITVSTEALVSILSCYQLFGKKREAELNSSRR